MSKILITGDLHSDTGIYIDITVNYLRDIMTVCKNEKINDIVFLGDLINKSTKVKHESFLPLYCYLRDMAKAGIRLWMLKGNHDIINNEGLSMFETFKPFSNVVDVVDRVEIGNRNFVFFSYSKDLTQLWPFKSSTDVLFTHLPLSGFKYDNEMTDGDSFDSSVLSEFKWVFSGHFHSHQTAGNIVYVGSPYQIDYGERGKKKGYILYETADDSWKFVEYRNAPVYVVTSIEDALNLDVKNTFVNIEIDRKFDNFSKLKHILYEKGALEVVPRYKETVDDTTINEAYKIDINNTVDVLIKEYINEMSSSEMSFDKKELCSMIEEAKLELF